MEGIRAHLCRDETAPWMGIRLFLLVGYLRAMGWGAEHGKGTMPGVA